MPERRYLAGTAQELAPPGVERRVVTQDEWLQKVLADRPPLTQAQIAVLRPILAPVLPQIRNAALARETRTAPAMSAPQEPLTRRSQ